MNENKNSEGKMPGEISLSSIELGMECRKYLQWYDAVGGDNVAFGDFKGRIIKIGRRGILFKRLYIDFTEMDGNYVTGKEDHIWVFDKRPFFKAKIKVNDCMSFTGIPMLCRQMKNWTGRALSGLSVKHACIVSSVMASVSPLLAGKKQGLKYNSFTI